MGAAGGWLEEYGSDFIIIGGCVSWRIGLMKFGEHYSETMKWKFENEGNPPPPPQLNLSKVENINSTKNFSMEWNYWFE